MRQKRKPPVKKEIRYCVDCGKPSSLRYPSLFKQPKEKYRCIPCSTKYKKNAIIKEMRYCVDCGTPSKLKSPKRFTRSKDEYLCRKCGQHHRDDNVVKEVWICTVCGTPSTPKQVTNFKQPKETYVCLKCAIKKAYQNPSLRKHASMIKQGITDEADWNGFTSAGEYCGKWTDPRYKVRKRVRARAGDCCDVCGKTYEENGNNHMSVHHVHRNKNACCEGEKTDWIFAALCKHCHGVYGHNEEGTQYLREVIAIERGNKCMLSLDEYNVLYPSGSDDDKKWGRMDGR